MTRDADPASSRPLQGDAALLRAVGSLALAAAVINIIVGGGIFKMPAALSSQVGAAAPLALLAGAVVMVPVALCFAAIGSRASATGGPYTYVSAVFGTLPGFLAGALMWICNVASSAGVAAALSLQVASLWPVFAAPVPRALLLLGVYAAIYALNAFGVKLGARAVMTLATLKLVPLFLLVLVGLAFVDTTQVSFAFSDVPSWTALGAAMVMVVFAYSGVETALIPGGEVRDPSRSVPRAAMSAILLVVLLYFAAGNQRGFHAGVREHHHHHCRAQRGPRGHVGEGEADVRGIDESEANDHQQEQRHQLQRRQRHHRARCCWACIPRSTHSMPSA